MNQETANYIMQRMSKYLDNSQMIKLKDSLDGAGAGHLYRWGYRYGNRRIEEVIS